MPASPLERNMEISVIEADAGAQARIHTVLANRIFVQLHLSGTGGRRTLNRYYNIADEGVTWVRGPLDSEDARSLIRFAHGLPPDEWP